MIRRILLLYSTHLQKKIELRSLTINLAIDRKNVSTIKIVFKD